MPTEDQPTNPPADGAKPDAGQAPAPTSTEVNILAPDAPEKLEWLKQSLEALPSGRGIPMSLEDMNALFEKAPEARIMFANMHRLANKQNEALIERQRAIDAREAEINPKFEALRGERDALIERMKSLREMFDPEKLKATDPKWDGQTEPNPMDPNPKVQAYYAQKHVNESLKAFFEPIDKATKETIERYTKEQETAAFERTRDEIAKFIEATPDMHAYFDDVKRLVKENGLSVPRAYHLAKAERLQKPDAPKVDPTKEARRTTAHPAKATPETDMEAFDKMTFKEQIEHLKRNPDMAKKIAMSNGIGLDWKS